MKKTSGTDWERLNAMGDEDIDTSDITELDDDFFQQAELHLPVKKPVTIRLDADVLEWFQGQGYQTQINNLLRKYFNCWIGRFSLTLFKNQDLTPVLLGLDALHNALDG